MRVVGYFPVKCGLSPDGRFAYFSGTIEAGLTPNSFGLYALRLDGQLPKLTRLDAPSEADLRKRLPWLLGVSSQFNRIYYLVETKPPRLGGRDLIVAELESGIIRKSVALAYQSPVHAIDGSATLDSDEYLVLGESKNRWAYLDEGQSLVAGAIVLCKGSYLTGIANWRKAHYVDFNGPHSPATACVDYRSTTSGELVWVRYRSTNHVSNDFHDVIWNHGNAPRARFPKTRDYSRLFVSRSALYSVLLNEDRNGYKAYVVPLSKILEGIAEAALSPKGVFQLTPIK